MYETPSHLFLNKLLKPNTENVLGGPPTSLGNLLILPKKSSYNKCCFRGGGWKCMKNALPPPLYTLLGVGDAWNLSYFPHVPKSFLTAAVRSWHHSTFRTIQLKTHGFGGEWSDGKHWSLVKFPGKKKISWNLSMTCQEFGHAGKKKSSPNCRLSAWHSPAHYGNETRANINCTN